MGIVVRFPRRHARASAISRAAKAVRISAVTPASTARGVLSSSDQYSGGTLSRCHHLDTCVAVVPGNSEAIASREFPHSSMIFRNEVKSDMLAFIGQSVLKRKAIPSLDYQLALGHNVRMASFDKEAEYKQQFIERVREARIATGMKQWQAAEGLGIPQDHYKHYEVLKGGKGRLMPHHLIAQFCVICRVNLEWLVTGKGKKAWQPLKILEQVPEAAKIAKPRRGRGSRAA